MIPQKNKVSLLSYFPLLDQVGQLLVFFCQNYSKCIKKCNNNYELKIVHI